MTQAILNDREDLEQLRRRFEEFRGAQTSRVRLPAALMVGRRESGGAVRSERGGA
jgi:hypothetical protein